MRSEIIFSENFYYFASDLFLFFLVKHFILTAEIVSLFMFVFVFT